MKIGVLVIQEKSILRLDVLCYLQEIKNNNCEIIAIHSKGKRYTPDIQEKNVFDNIVNVGKGTSLRNSVLKFAYNYFGYLPVSLNNYKIVNYFNQSSVLNGFKRFILRLKFKMSLLTPKFFSYDTYLANLRSSTLDGNFPEIDCMLVFTHIEEDEILSYYKVEGVPIFIYLYSWDHACKLKRLPSNAKYLVWNEGVAKDLSKLNRIDINKVFVVGSTQLGLINQYKELPKNNIGQLKTGSYVLFAFSTAHKSLIEDEIDFVLYLSRLLKQSKIDIHILVRAYPNYPFSAIYDPIKEYDNISFFDSTNSKLSTVDSINEKYRQIENALGVFHFGTTLGLEATFFNTPVFLVDYYAFLKRKRRSIHLSDFVHQYQNDKYLNLKEFPNVVCREGELCNILMNLNNLTIENYLMYNAEVRSKFATSSISDIATASLEIMSKK